jgi:tRNA pseudouridine55 synthase
LSASDNEARSTGVLNVNKPGEWTSHDVVAVVRGVIGERRVGHGGTLDPLATGVLPVLVGAATKFVERLHTAPKVYAAVVRFGSETTTDDAGGSTTREAPVPARERAVEALQRFRGVISQRPPDYAAVKVGGRTAYSRARAGESVELAAREVQVIRLDMTHWTGEADLGLLIVCTSGTYVRSLARDLGRACDSAAHLVRLRRLAVGALDIAEAIGIEELRREGRAAVLARLRPADDALLTLPERYLTAGADRLVLEESTK